MRETAPVGTDATLPEWPVARLKAAPGASPGRGRGVYALERIEKGEVVERACSIELTSAQCDALEEMLPLGDFYFQHPEDPEQGLLLLGLVSLLNHSEEPNVEVRYSRVDGLGWIADVVAKTTIEANSELFHRYRCPPWFECVDQRQPAS